MLKVRYSIGGDNGPPDFGLCDFVQNWNTKGGCGWQTKAPNVCSGNPNRGCFDNDDCNGQCIFPQNPFLSSRDLCANNGECPSSPDVCNGGGAATRFTECNDSGDCGGAPCGPLPQICDGQEGICSATVADTGGIWHTGLIGTTDLICDSLTNPACGSYDTISTTGGNLLWFELLTTPVLEKVDTSNDAQTGLPNSNPLSRTCL